MKRNSNPRKWHFSVFVIFLVSALCLLPISDAGATKEKRTVKIGVIGDLTGSGAPWGLAYRNILQIFAGRINNAGGMTVGDEQIFFEIIAKDDKWVPSESVMAANSLVYSDKVDFLFILYTDGVNAIKPIVSENKIPTFCCGWGNFLSPDAPYVFRNVIDEYAGAFASLGYISKTYQDKKNMAIITADTGDFQDIAKGDTKVWENLGNKVVSTILYPPDTIDFNSVAASTMAKNPDIIDVTTQATHLPLISKALRSQGFTGLFYSGSQAEEVIEGLITVSVVPGDPKESPDQIAVREIYQAKYGELHPWWEFFGNFAYGFFNDFFKDAGSADRDKVYQTITAPGYTFDTWWGEAHWFGKDVKLWGIDRQIASNVPISIGINGKWQQLGYVENDIFIPLYKTLVK